jgi:hypothetical protein
MGVPAAAQQQLPPQLALLGAKLAQEPIGASLLANGVWSPASPASRWQLALAPSACMLPWQSSLPAGWREPQRPLVHAAA